MDLSKLGVYMHLERDLMQSVLAAAREYQVIGIMGPLHSGKTTLAQGAFPDHRYVSLEDYDIRLFARTDPRGFLNQYPSTAGLILDEIQHVPELLSYIQTIVDREKKNGFFVVTGSQNFLVDEAITQTLAGRMAIFTLLPLSIHELRVASALPKSLEQLIFKGMYPKAHAEDVLTPRLYGNYIRAYVERDVRQIKNIADLSMFQKFMRLCAGRVGQLLNVTSLGNDCGINQGTVKAWLSLLEASYIIFFIHPYYRNFGKRLIKAPKLYFVDTGVACSLLNIRSNEELANHYLRGGLVESFILSDILKQQYNSDQQPSLYFWRDKAGAEIDGIIDTARMPIAVEIKAGQTVATDFFKELNNWQKTTGESSESTYLIYAGDDDQRWPQAQVLGWRSAGDLISRL